MQNGGGGATSCCHWLSRLACARLEVRPQRRAASMRHPCRLRGKLRSITSASGNWGCPELHRSSTHPSPEGTRVWLQREREGGGGVSSGMQPPLKALEHIQGCMRQTAKSAGIIAGPYPCVRSWRQAWARRTRSASFFWARRSGGCPLQTPRKRCRNRHLRHSFPLLPPGPSDLESVGWPWMGILQFQSSIYKTHESCLASNRNGYHLPI